MYNIIPLILILLSIIIMLIIFIKNYSGFCELQVKKIKSTPVVKKEFKDQIVVDRLEKIIVGFFSKKERNLLFTYIWVKMIFYFNIFLSYNIL